MGMEFLLAAVVLLACFAVFDLIIGVSNDAVNFLNSSIASRVAPRFVIMIIASLGIIAGVTFSSGMMEVARKGIFHPRFFSMPEMLTIFLAVMLTDLVLLDLFNTFGLPTSTTVSIVFELLGAAIAVSVVKIVRQHDNLASLAQYINTGKALVIIIGILLSVGISFALGAIVQCISRLLFTFDYTRRMRRYGALWGGVALSSITYFILVKGAKGASFITPETAVWIKGHTMTILAVIFAVSSVVLQVLLLLRVNILKPIVLIGTFALAMAFAANDLMNFIGVPVAGFHAYKAALASGAPLTAKMAVLGQKVPTATSLLLIAGAIMVATLWLSRKSRTVSETEISLGQQEEGEEKFESVYLSRMIVRIWIGAFDTAKRIVPARIRETLWNRFDAARYKPNVDEQNRPAFDLLRAAVNLMSASAVISFATSQQLPLSTTYVTFMVSMGSSFADLAWGRESAVYRITGVLTVIGGWFVTALAASSAAFVMAIVIFYGKAVGMLALLVVASALIWNNHHTHKERAEASRKDTVFNLKKVQSISAALSASFVQIGLLLQEIRESLDTALEALFTQNSYALKAERRKTRKIQQWTNIIIANVFKAMRLLQKKDAVLSHQYAQTIRRLQKLADGHRDIVVRASRHVSNHHAGLLEDQVEELKEVRRILLDILLEVESTFSRRQLPDRESLMAKDRELRDLADRLNKKQIGRIRTETSKTRLTILYYAIAGNAIMLSKQNLKLLDIFQKSFGGASASGQFDLD